MKQNDTVKETLDTIQNLNLNDKESIVNFLFLVQTGNISCRRAATEIMRRYNHSMICQNISDGPNTEFYNGL